MGVFINLHFDPTGVKKETWEEVYNETLQLVEAWDFCDIIFDTTTYPGANWRYLVKAAERQHDRGLGWYFFGNLSTLHMAEDFILYKNLDYYQESFRGELLNKDTVPTDIYAQLARFYDYDILTTKEFQGHGRTIFQSKTQRFPHHIATLAIALLIENRLPENAAVSGDIDLTDLKTAVIWANKHLKNEIKLPERVDDSKLAKRAKGMSPDPTLCLTAFFRLTFSYFSPELRLTLLQHFSEDDLKAYYKKEINERYAPISKIVEFLDLGFALEDLCEILVFDENNSYKSPEDFIESLLYNNSYKVFKEEKTKEVFITYFGDMCDVEAIYHEFVKEKELPPPEPDEDDEIIAEVIKKMNQAVKAATEVKPKEADITNFTELISWKPGQTFSKNITESLEKLSDFIQSIVQKQKYELDADFDSPEPIARLIKDNTYFLIKKSVWDFIIENCKNRHFYRQFSAFFLVKADGISTHRLCTSIANNPELITHLFLKNQPEDIKDSDKPQNAPTIVKENHKKTLEERCWESFEIMYKEFTEKHSSLTFSEDYKRDFYSDYHAAFMKGYKEGYEGEIKKTVIWLYNNKNSLEKISEIMKLPLEKIKEMVGDKDLNKEK